MVTNIAHIMATLPSVMGFVSAMGSRYPFVTTFIYITAWRMHDERFRNIDRITFLLGQGRVSRVGFWSDFRISGFLGFSFRFKPGSFRDRSVHSRGPFLMNFSRIGGRKFSCLSFGFFTNSQVRVNIAVETVLDTPPGYINIVVEIVWNTPIGYSNARLRPPAN